METYTPNANESDVAFLESLQEFSDAGIAIIPLPSGESKPSLNRFRSAHTLYSVHDDGGVTKVNCKGSFYIGKVS